MRTYLRTALLDIPDRPPATSRMRAAAFLSIFALAITAPGTGDGLVDSLGGRLRPLSDGEVVRQEMEARIDANRAAVAGS